MGPVYRAIYRFKTIEQCEYSIDRKSEIIFSFFLFFWTWEKLNIITVDFSFLNILRYISFKSD